MLALQNHGPDIVNSADDVMALIQDVGEPAFKACLDISIEPQPESAEHAERIAKAAGKLQVHSHFNGEFGRRPDGTVELLGGGYFDDTFWGRKVAYPAYVAALVKTGYTGFMNWEYCHPAKRNGADAGIDYVHEQTRMGELVMFCQGSSSRLAGGLKDLPVDAVIVGIVDVVDVFGKEIYNARNGS